MNGPNSTITSNQITGQRLPDPILLGQYVHDVPTCVSTTAPPPMPQGLAPSPGTTLPPASFNYLGTRSTASHLSHHLLSLDELLGTIDAGGLLGGRKSRKPSIFDDHPFTCPQPRFGFRCKEHGCVACLITEARRRAGAIRMAAPTHSFTLTQVGHDRHTAMRSIRRFRRLLDANYGNPVKVCGSIETTPGNHPHVHGFLYVTGALHDALKLDMDFMAATNRAGLGDCRIDRIGHDDWLDYAGEIAEARAEQEVVASYFSYPMKTLADDDLLDSFLELNRLGEKYGLGFQSNDFFRDGVEGEPMKERDAKQRAYERAQGHWADHRADDFDDDEGPLDVEELDHIAELMFIDLTGGQA
jgi:hypothetical protein